MASNIELYLSKMLGENVETPSPRSRIELQLARLLGENVECPAPHSTVEALLDKLYENGFSGGSGANGLSKWTKIEGLRNIQNIEYGSGVWVAACGTSGIRYSEDGITWNEANIYGSALGNGDFDENVINTVKYNGVVWVAGGAQLSGLDQDGDGVADHVEWYASVYISSDGKRWELQTLGFDYNGVATVDNLFYNNGIWHASTYPSADGNVLFYTDRDDARGWAASNWGLWYYDGYAAIQYIDGVWYAKTDCALNTSTDGIKWTAVYSSDDYRGIACTYGNGAWVIIDYAQETIVWSNDLSTWSSTDGLIFTHGAEVDYVDGVWIATETYSGLKYSIDGKTWSISLRSDFEVTNIQYADGVIYARKTYEDNRPPESYVSRNGISWRESPDMVSSITKIGDNYIAAISGGIFYSNDGLTWIETNITPGSSVYSASITKSESAVILKDTPSAFYAKLS